jgi:hypothetical protein
MRFRLSQLRPMVFKVGGRSEEVGQDNKRIGNWNPGIQSMLLFVNNIIVTSLHTLFFLFLFLLFLVKHPPLCVLNTLCKPMVQGWNADEVPVLHFKCEMEIVWYFVCQHLLAKKVNCIDLKLTRFVVGRTY